MIRFFSSLPEKESILVHAFYNKKKISSQGHTFFF